MKSMTVSLLTCVLAMGYLAARPEKSQALELRLVSVKEMQLVREPPDLQLFLVNNGTAPAYVDRRFLVFHIDAQMGLGGEWVVCGQMHRGTSGVRDEARWQRIDPRASLLIGVGGFWCPEDAGPVSSGRDWTEIPGGYKLKVEVSHKMLADELERVGPAPEGARDWEILRIRRSDRCIVDL